MKKILFADDDIDYLQLVCLRLKNAGFAVATAVDGEDALTVARDFDPSLIVLDIHMPKLNGFETYQLLREEPRLSRKPVVFISSAEPDEIKELAGFPAVTFLAKSDGAGLLIETIEKLLP